MAENTPKNAKEEQGSFLESGGAFLQGVVNGPTFGLVNKVEAGAISAFSDVTYHDKLMQIRAFEDMHPTAYKAGEYTGDGVTVAASGGLLVAGIKAAEIGVVSVRAGMLAASAAKGVVASFLTHGEDTSLGMLAASAAKGVVAGAATLGAFEVAHAGSEHFVPSATPKMATKVAQAIQVASK